ncbi:MAG: hypothetical protein ACR2NP_17375 [Pirellulaceae bacterium]
MQRTHPNSLAIVLPLIMAVFTTCPLLAQTKLPADLLPEGADMAYMVRDLAEFNTKLTKTVSEVWTTISEDDVWDLYFYSLGDLETEGTINRDGIGGVVLAKVDGQGELFLTYPIEDVSVVAEHFGVAADQLRDGQAFQVGNKKIVMLDDHLYVLTPWFNLFPEHDQDVSEIELPLGDMSSITNLLSNEDFDVFCESDCVLMLGGGTSKEFWGQILGGAFGPQSWTREAAGFSDTDAEQMWERLKAAGREIRFGLAAIDLDDGVHVRTKSFLHETEDNAALQLIRDVRGGDEPSDLMHLPDGQVLLATAVKGDGEENVMVARSIMRLIVEIVSPGEDVLTGDDKREFYDLFSSIWQQLNGTRVALYRNTGEIGDGGELAVVIIFDANEPAELLASIPGLVNFANAGIARNTDPGTEPTIQFEYRSGDSTIGELTVDALEIDTSRIGERNQQRITRFFGNAAGNIRFVPIRNKVVMFVGTNPQLLEAALTNVRDEKPGLVEHPAFLASESRLDPRRKFELHMSAVNLNYIYSATIRKR